MNVISLEQSLEWCKFQFNFMAGRIDDLICNFDIYNLDEIGPIHVLLISWLIFVCFLIVLYFASHIFIHLSSKPIFNFNNRNCSLTQKHLIARASFLEAIEESENEDRFESVDDDKVSRCRNFVVTGSNANLVQWTDNFLDNIYDNLPVCHYLSQLLFDSWNKRSAGFSHEVGLQLEFISFADFSLNILRVTVQSFHDRNESKLLIVCKPKLTIDLQAKYEQFGEKMCVDYKAVVVATEQEIQLTFQLTSFTDPLMLVMCNLDCQPHIKLCRTKPASSSQPVPADNVAFDDSSPDYVTMEEHCRLTILEDAVWRCFCEFGLHIDTSILAAHSLPMFPDLLAKFTRTPQLPAVEVSADVSYTNHELIAGADLHGVEESEDVVSVTSQSCAIPARDGDSHELPTHLHNNENRNAFSETIQLSNFEVTPDHVFLLVLNCSVENDDTHMYCSIECDKPRQKFTTKSVHGSYFFEWNEVFKIMAPDTACNALFELFVCAVDDIQGADDVCVATTIVSLDEVCSTDITPSPQLTSSLTRPVIHQLSLIHQLQPDASSFNQIGSISVQCSLDYDRLKYEQKSRDLQPHSQPNSILPTNEDHSNANKSDLSISTKPTIVIHSVNDAVKFEKRSSTLPRFMSPDHSADSSRCNSRLSDDYDSLQLRRMNSRSGIFGSIRRKMKSVRVKRSHTFSAKSSSQNESFADTRFGSRMGRLSEDCVSELSVNTDILSASIEAVDKQGSRLMLEVVDSDGCTKMIPLSNKDSLSKMKKSYVKCTKIRMCNFHWFVSEYISSHVTSRCTVCAKALSTGGWRPLARGRRKVYSCRRCHVLVHVNCHTRVTQCQSGEHYQQ